jgi:hypothetical protein
MEQYLFMEYEIRFERHVRKFFLSISLLGVNHSMPKWETLASEQGYTERKA